MRLSARTCLAARIEVALELFPTANTTLGLVDPSTIDPETGAKTAESWALWAENDVLHVLVTLWVPGTIGSLAHPEIAVAPLRNVTAPDGDAAGSVDVTVAVSVTCWLATALLTEVESVMELVVGVATASAWATPVNGPPVTATATIAEMKKGGIARVGGEVLGWKCPSLRRQPARAVTSSTLRS
jgi:hypothetical protein